MISFILVWYDSHCKAGDRSRLLKWGYRESHGGVSLLSSGILSLQVWSILLSPTHFLSSKFLSLPFACHALCHEVIGRDSVLLYMLELKGHGKVCMKEEDENDHLKGILLSLALMSNIEKGLMLCLFLGKRITTFRKTSSSFVFEESIKLQWVIQQTYSHLVSGLCVDVWCEG